MPDSDVRITPSPAGFAAELEEAARELPERSREANAEIAGLLAGAAGERYERLHAHQSGDGRRSIIGGKGSHPDTLLMGGSSAPYVLGQNFGSGQGPGKEMFPPRGRPDYVLYDALADNIDQILRVHGAVIDDVLGGAFRG